MGGGRVRLTRMHKFKPTKSLNPIKAGGSESMYSLGGRPTPPPP